MITIGMAKWMVAWPFVILGLTALASMLADGWDNEGPAGVFMVLLLWSAVVSVGWGMYVLIISAR